MPQRSIFPTDLGWFGLVGSRCRVFRLFIGHISADEVRESFRRQDVAAISVDGASAGSISESDWFPELRMRLEQYARGMKADFTDCEVEFPQLTPFQRRVLAATRTIPYGQTLTYGQLAAKAGSPRAARAVGTVMSANRVPIIIPCHRVVAAGGKLGGYSAPQGVNLKQQLLEMEADGEF